MRNPLLDQRRSTVRRAVVSANRRRLSQVGRIRRRGNATP